MTTLDVDAVKVFVAIADLQSFTRAAETLGTTQGAISVKLKRLEDQLGQKLVERTPRQVRLSAQGAIFIESAREFLAAHDRAVAGLTSNRRRFALGIASHVGGPDLGKPIAERLHAGLARPATAYAAMASWGAFPKIAYETDDARLGAIPLLIVLSAPQNHPQQDLCRGPCIAKIAAASTRTTGPMVIPDSTHGSLVIGKQEDVVAGKIVAFANALPQK